MVRVKDGVMSHDSFRLPEECEEPVEVLRLYGRDGHRVPLTICYAHEVNGSEAVVGFDIHCSVVCLAGLENKVTDLPHSWVGDVLDRHFVVAWCPTKFSCTREVVKDDVPHTALSHYERRMIRSESLISSVFHHDWKMGTSPISDSTINEELEGCVTEEQDQIRVHLPYPSRQIMQCGWSKSSFTNFVPRRSVGDHVVNKAGDTLNTHPREPRIEYPSSSS